MSHINWSADPILLSFFGINIGWYGLLFGGAIFLGSKIMESIYRNEGKDVQSLDSLFLFSVVGIVLGARLVHCLFYEPSYYLSNPLEILKIWKGGLASHGGGLGVLLGTIYYCKKYNMNYLWVVDRLAIPTALFGFFVRMGNFFNSEILGNATDVPWAIVFSRIDSVPRHPAQLYEALAYLVIFIGLYTLYKRSYKSLATGTLFGTFLILTFTARILVEFFKQRQAAYSADFLLSTGQLLSIPFILVGVVLVLRAVKTKPA